MKDESAFCDRYASEIAEVMPLKAAVVLLQSLKQHYYGNISDLANQESLHHDVLANLVRRQSAFERHLLPWVNIRRPLANTKVADIGCGTGSSTVAFSRVANEVHGYEIDEKSTLVAKKRIEVLDIHNAHISLINPEETIDRLYKDFPDGADIISLVAVLEHMTEKERMRFLPEIWKFMRPGNVLVVAETPNRLTYNDDHTAEMPFFHMLPTDLKVRYAINSARSGLHEALSALADTSGGELETLFCRLGIGISYHDFEIGFDTTDLETCLIGDGFETPILNWWPPLLEEHILMNYFVEKPILKPLAFCRNVLNLIFVKPHPNETGSTLRHNAEHIKKIWKQYAFPIKGLERMDRLIQ